MDMNYGSNSFLVNASMLVGGAVLAAGAVLFTDSRNRKALAQGTTDAYEATKAKVRSFFPQAAVVEVPKAKRKARSTKAKASAPVYYRDPSNKGHSWTKA